MPGRLPRADVPSDVVLPSGTKELAVLGGAPAFKSQISVGAPNQPNREKLLTRFNEVLDRNWLTNFGPCNHAFSREIRRQTGAKHAIPVANGTVGLELAIRALELKGEVIVPAFTFVATAHALQWLGITPVFCDVNPETHCIDPKCITQAITPRTSGIIGVHLWGHPCDVDEINGIAADYDLRVVYDAAHAFGTAHAGVPIGNFGDAEVFSFHATKFVNSLEGGAILTNRDDIARKVILMANFGFTGYDQVEYIGTNGKLNEIAAAFGLSSLEEVDRIVEINRANYLVYQSELGSLPGVRFYLHDHGTQPNYQYVVLEIDRHQSGLSRDQLLTVLHAENIIARRYFYPGCHRMEPYCNHTDPDAQNLPVTERLTSRVLCLPTGSRVGPEAITCIAGIIRQAIAQAKDIDTVLDDAARQRASPFGLTDF